MLFRRSKKTEPEAAAPTERREESPTASSSAPIAHPWSADDLPTDADMMPSNELLKRATALHGEGKLEEAIATLRSAYAVSETETVDHGVETFIRLPNYLQQAGRSEEAWGIFEWLLKRGHTTGRSPEIVEPMILSVIFDKMRGFLQREGRANEAIAYGCLSVLGRAKGLHLQDRDAELARVKEAGVAKECGALFKKAKLADDSPIAVRVSALLKRYLSDPRSIDLNDARNTLLSTVTDKSEPE